MIRRLLLVGLGATMLVLAAGQVAAALGAQRVRAALRPTDPTGREVIVVLGYGNDGTELNAVNRWRLDVGLRSRDPRASSSLLLLSGGAVRGAHSEAGLMARHLREHLGFEGEVALETQSRSTWDNMACTVPFLEDADRIVVASDPLHELRAHGMLRTQRPDLAARLAAADNCRPGEQLLRGPWTTVIGLEGLRRARRDGQIRG